MLWIMLTTAMLIIFGGMLAVLPSKRERLIGQMRIEARKQGLHIGSESVRNVNAPMHERVTSGGRVKTPMIQCVVWGKHYTEEFAEIPTWRLLKSAKNKSPIAGYVADPPLSDEQNQMDSSYWSEIQKVLENLPGRLVAIQCTQQTVSWIGNETIDTTADRFIAQMSIGLDQLMELNIASVARKAP